MHRLSSQHIEVTGSKNPTDFNAMKYWMERNGIQPEVCPYKAELVHATIVQSWLDFKRKAVFFRHTDFDRNFLENAAREKCDPEQYYELNDSMDNIPDHELIIIAQLF